MKNGSQVLIMQKPTQRSLHYKRLQSIRLPILAACTNNRFMASKIWKLHIARLFWAISFIYKPVVLTEMFEQLEITNQNQVQTIK